MIFPIRKLVPDPSNQPFQPFNPLSTVEMATAAVTIAVPAAPTTLKNQTFDQASKLSLAEQLELAMTILKGLKKAIGGKKASRARDEAEPKEKKNLTPAMAAWHANLKVVREAVQEAADPKFSLKNAMSVAKALRTAGSWPEPSQEAILEAYEAWKDGEWLGQVHFMIVSPQGTAPGPAFAGRIGFDFKAEFPRRAFVPAEHRRIVRIGF